MTAAGSTTAASELDRTLPAFDPDCACSAKHHPSASTKAVQSRMTAIRGMKGPAAVAKARNELREELHKAGCDDAMAAGVLGAVEQLRLACERVESATEAVEIARSEAAKRDPASKRNRAQPTPETDVDCLADIELEQAEHGLKNAEARLKRAKNDVHRANDLLSYAQSVFDTWIADRQQRATWFVLDAIDGMCEPKPAAAAARECAVCKAKGTLANILGSTMHAQAMGYDVSKPCNFVPLCDPKEGTKSCRHEFDTHVRGFMCLEPHNENRQTRRWVSFTMNEVTSESFTIPTGPHCRPLHERAKIVLQRMHPDDGAHIRGQLKTAVERHQKGGHADTQRTAELCGLLENSSENRRWARSRLRDEPSAERGC